MSNVKSGLQTQLTVEADNIDDAKNALMLNGWQIANIEDITVQKELPKLDTTLSAVSSPALDGDKGSSSPYQRANESSTRNMSSTSTSNGTKNASNSPRGVLGSGVDAKSFKYLCSLYFKPESSSLILTKESMDLLRSVKDGDKELVIIGHSNGTEFTMRRETMNDKRVDDNSYKLALNRSVSVRDYLLTLGKSKDSMLVSAVGINSNKLGDDFTPPNTKNDRRVDIYGR